MNQIQPQLSLSEIVKFSVESLNLVVHNGEILTLQQAGQLLKSTDRTIRKEVYDKITNRRLEDVKQLDDLFDELIQLRQQVALNAGFDNFRDYMFSAMGRFDYSPEDCINFHNSVKKHIVPIVTKLEKERKKKLKLSLYKTTPFEKIL